MTALRQSGDGFGRRWAGAVAGACLLVVLQGARGSAPAESGPWDAAVMARQIFEAKPQGTHTKAEYSEVMDGFRAIYHGNPADPHASQAVEQVAELLAEEGREFNERKALRNAAGQYEFLAAAYPGGRLAPAALGHALELLGPEAAADAEESQKVRALLVATYPRSAEARALTAEEAPAVADARKAGAAAAPMRADRASSYQAMRAGGDTDSATDETVAGTKAEASGTPAKMAMVTGIRHWSTPSYTRVAIDLGDAVEYQAARVEHPDRIFFDLHHARLASQLTGKSFAVDDDGFLTRIRAAQFSGDVTRVVLDVHQVAEYSAFLLPNPYRLIIDMHGGGDAHTKQLAAGPEASVPANQRARVEELGPALPGSTTAAGSHEARPTETVHSNDVQVSSLPPMPITDGSAGFGLASRDGADDSSKRAVAPARVVIPSKATTSRPVPNAVATRSAQTGVEVAAVSDQPGKVEATRRPTSQPIVDRTPAPGEAGGPRVTGSAKVSNSKGSKTRGHVAGEPAEPAPPTAEGEATLMRALGLKIGRIVIDAGHGGHDSGTLGAGGIEEKDVVLDVALRLGKLLRDRLGAEIVYTRADDTFIPLETRTAIANKAQADLFISVHANSSQDASARGVEVYYLNFTSDPEAMQVASRENAVSTQSVHQLSDLVKKIALKDKIDESRELAEDVDQSLFRGLTKGNEGLRDRGVKKAPFVVLIGANMPSILAEISFVTNPSDAEALRRSEYRERVAESLYSGVARYAKAINGSKHGTPTERAALGR